MRIKDFYVRCIGLLTKCTNIDKFRQIFCDILIVSASETEESITDEEIRCLTAQNRLIQLIKNDEMLYDTNCEINGAEENLINHLDDKCGSKITNFLQTIQSESKSSDTGERLNPYWCPEFGNKVKLREKQICHILITYFRFL